MTEDRKLNRRTAVYVSAVGEALAAMNSADREAVLEDVEDHIDAALRDRSESPTLEHLEAVLAELGSPESYAAELQAQLAPGQERSVVPVPDIPARLCKQAAMGLGWSILMLAVVPAAMISVPVPEAGVEDPGVSLGQHLFSALAWFALAGLLGGPLLSALAISKIRASAGRLYGLGPAVLGLYLIPFAAIDLFLFGASSSFIESRLEDQDSLAFFLLSWCCCWRFGGTVALSAVRSRN